MQCWICLDDGSATPLHRNPAGCTCTDGGWIHDKCMETYLKSAAANRRCSLRASTRSVEVTAIHAPCAKRMTVSRHPLPPHRFFLVYWASAMLAQFIYAPMLSYTVFEWVRSMFEIAICIRVNPALALISYALAMLPLHEFEWRHHRKILRCALLGSIAAILGFFESLCWGVLGDVFIYLIIARAILIRLSMYRHFKPWLIDVCTEKEEE